MIDQEVSFQVIDEVFRDFATRLTQDPNYWLFIQTIFTASGRREFIQKLSLAEKSKVLDIGTGFGAFALELAAAKQLDIIAVDTDPAIVDTAKEILSEVTSKRGVKSESSIQYQYADIYELPFPDQSFDFVIIRLVFQHLKNPDRALKDVYRVIKPGGVLCVVDIDDQITMVYPEYSAAFSSLREAFTRLQNIKGGDRQIGKKLPHLMHQAGFSHIDVEIKPQTAYAYIEENDLSLQFSLLRFMQVREELIMHGFVDSKDFDSWIQQLRSEWGMWQFSANAEMYIAGIK